MMIPLYISIAVFIAYLSAIILRYGVPASISDSYYVLGDNTLLSSLFTWFCWLTGGFLLTVWLDGGGGLLAFLACGGLMFVGTAPLFKSHQKTMHFGSAIVCFVSAYAWLFINDLILAVISVGVLVAFYFVKKRTFWWEVTAFVTIYISLL